MLTAVADPVVLIMSDSAEASEERRISGDTMMVQFLWKQLIECD
jgi:hypothetical protein